MFLISGLLILSCNKDEDEDEVSDRFRLLTTPVWASDSLLVNGVDASGTGEWLESFKGDAKFNNDKTGEFGGYEGSWSFSSDETKLVINSTALPFPITVGIVELTDKSLKITTSLPLDFSKPDETSVIRMTFKAK